MGTMAVRRGQTATEGSGHKMSILISPVCFKTKDARAIFLKSIYKTVFTDARCNPQTLSSAKENDSLISKSFDTDIENHGPTNPLV